MGLLLDVLRAGILHSAGIGDVVAEHCIVIEQLAAEVLAHEGVIQELGGTGTSLRVLD